jgi:hypothetical protein
VLFITVSMSNSRRAAGFVLSIDKTKNDYLMMSSLDGFTNLEATNLFQETEFAYFLL